MLDWSMANGPGRRAVVWLQGCDLRCHGCCNPEFQPMTSGVEVKVTPALLSRWFVGLLQSDPELRGITLSGGEPLHPRQRADVLSFIDLCRSSAPRPFDVMAFTGYLPVPDDVTGIDLFIAGPYEASMSNPSGIVSSLNQAIVRSSDAFVDVPDDVLLNGRRIVEVRMSQDGVVMVTGLSGVEETRGLLGLS